MFVEGKIVVKEVDIEMDDFNDCRQCAKDAECDHIKGSWLHCWCEGTQGCYGFVEKPKPRVPSSDPHTCERWIKFREKLYYTQCGISYDSDIEQYGGKFKHCFNCGKPVKERA